MRIVRATFVAMTAFLGGAIATVLLSVIVLVGYVGVSFGRTLAYSAVPAVILATTLAVLQAQRSLSNADWRQAVMTVPEAMKAGVHSSNDYNGLLPPSHWGLPEDGDEEAKAEGLAAELPYWSSKPVLTWSGPVAEVPSGELPKRRSGEESEAGETTEAATVTTLVLPGDKDALAAAVAEALRQAGPGTWQPSTGPAAG